MILLFLYMISFQIDIIDAQGKILYSKRNCPQNTYQISLEGIPNGLYLLQIQTKNRRILGTKKFVIQRE